MLKSNEKIIYIGADHAGFELKEKDYPNYALKVSKRILETRSKGILICGTGI